jgi:hypothetical protein
VSLWIETDEGDAVAQPLRLLDLEVDEELEERYVD